MRPSSLLGQPVRIALVGAILTPYNAVVTLMYAIATLIHAVLTSPFAVIARVASAV